MKSKAVIIALVFLAFVSGWLIRGGLPQEHHHHNGAEDAGAHTGNMETEAETSDVWTCSMHPQIKLPDPGQCPICFMDLIPQNNSDSNQGEGSERQLVLTPETRALMNIETVRAERRHISSNIRLYGRIDMDERQVETVSARFPGRIETMYVDYTGQKVDQGEQLFTIYSPELLTMFIVPVLYSFLPNSGKSK